MPTRFQVGDWVRYTSEQGGVPLIGRVTSLNIYSDTGERYFVKFRWDEKQPAKWAVGHWRYALCARSTLEPASEEEVAFSILGDNT